MMHNDIELYDAETRINPSGHRELVIKKKGKKDEEILNELEEDIEFTNSAENMRIDSPESNITTNDKIRTNGDTITNMSGPEKLDSDGPDRSRAKANITATMRGKSPRDKYITGYYDDGLDSAVTYNESFTGTGAIAMVPGSQPMDENDLNYDEEDDEDDDNLHVEHKNKSLFDEEQKGIIMSHRILNEWEPSFDSGDYEPGDAAMHSPTGNGVANKNAKHNNVGKFSANTKNTGEAWPRKHNDTPAMCDVDEDGVENDPQGVHVSEVGDPDDHHTTEMGKDWPHEPKNAGGISEPFEGTRYTDSGTLSSSMEDWSPDGIGNLMEGADFDILKFFNEYARTSEYVCLEDFENLLRAYGSDVIIDENSIIDLMAVNEEFIFHEGVDSNGRYWVAESFNGQSTKSLAESSSAMNSPTGTKINSKSMKDSPHLPKHDVELDEMGEPLGMKQKNSLKGTPIMKGTEKSSGKNAEVVKENAIKIAKHVQRHLSESNVKTNNVFFKVVVQERNSTKKTKQRSNLTEAVADAEEILQLHPVENVVLESSITRNGKVIKKIYTPMIKVKSRGPIFSEGKALFRFERTAKGFSNNMISEGKVCKINKHNWGFSVGSLTR